MEEPKRGFEWIKQKRTEVFLKENGYSKYIKDFKRNGFFTLQDIAKYDHQFGNEGTLTKIKEAIGDNDDVGVLYHLIMNEYKSKLRKGGLIGCGVFILIFVLFGLIMSSL